MVPTKAAFSAVWLTLIVKIQPPNPKTTGVQSHDKQQVHKTDTDFSFEYLCYEYMFKVGGFILRYSTIQVKLIGRSGFQEPQDIGASDARLL